MKQFLEQGRLIIGINYWASDNAIRMWEDWHPDVIEADFRRLAEAGVTVLRVFPLWSVFQPLTAACVNDAVREYQLDGHPLPDTDAGRAGVSEAACARFEQFCDLAERYGLQLLVGLITGHMSGRYFAPAPFLPRNPLTDPELIKWQLRFVRYFVGRFRDKPAIAAWDLGNELDNFTACTEFRDPDMAYLWASGICSTVRAIDRVHPVITGFGHTGIADCAFSHLEVAEFADLNTVHPYNIFHTASDPLPTMRPILDGIFRCRLSEGISGIPAFIQEVGSIGYLNCSERTEADFYRALLWAAWSHGCGSVMWWCAFDQGMQDHAPYDWNNIGSDYGFFRADGTPKPLVEENLRFRAAMASLPFDRLPPAITDGVCIVPRCKGNKLEPILRSTYCLAKQANLELTFAYATQPIPDAPLYILPSVDHQHAIPRRRLMEILDRVRAGATLYISLGSALFRMIPELTGTTFACREKGGSETVTVGDTMLHITGDYRYTPEQTGDAEVLARAADGRAVYLRRRYGEGYVYLSTLPIEKHLSQTPHAFRTDSEDYAAYYRCLKETIPALHVLDTDSTTVRITEHIADSGQRYAVLINYAGQPAEARLRLRSGWTIADVLHGKLTQDTLQLGPCEAAVLVLRA